MPDQDVFIRKSSGLVRQVSALDAFVYATMCPSLLGCVSQLVWTPYLFPGVHMPLAVLTVIEMFPIAGLYWLFSVAMPRSGGEYVYVSRVIHPAIGLMVSFVLSVTSLSWLGILQDMWMKWGLSDGFKALGILYHNPALTNIGVSLSQNWVRTVIGTLVLLVIGLGFMKGARWMMKLGYVTMAFCVLGIIVLGIAAAYGRNDFIANWNAWSSLKYDDVLKVASKDGFPLKFSAMATLMGGSTYVCLNTLGSTYSANMAGEVRGVQKSQLLALFGSLAVQMVLWFAFYQLCYSAWGSEWTNALMYLFNSGNKAYPFDSEPVATLLIVFMGKNPVLTVLFAVCFIFGIFGAGAGLGFAPTRNLFAWSFDRILPTKFTEINRRWRSPLWVVWISIACGWFFLMLDIWQPVWTANLGYTITGWFTAWIFLGVAGIIFPFRRKEMFKNAPPLVQSKFLGIPVISILGALTVLVSLFVVIDMMVPYFSGSLPSSVWVMTAALLVIPLVIYFISKAVHAKSGVSFEKQFQEIPPE